MKNKVKHLPQIEYFLVSKGIQVYQFIGDADLAALIKMRKHKLENDAPFFACKESRQTWLNHVESLESCIKCLMNNPTAEYALKQLRKQKREGVDNPAQFDADKFLNALSEENRIKFLELAKKFAKK